MFLGQAGLFLSFQARRSSGKRSSASDLTEVPLVLHRATLQLRVVQLENHIPINYSWVVLMVVFRLSHMNTITTMATPMVSFDLVFHKLSEKVTFFYFY